MGIPQGKIVFTRFRNIFIDQRFRELSETLGVRIFAITSGIITNILIARMLGPDGRGLYASALALAGAFVQFGTLGVGSANTFFAAKATKEDINSFSANSVLISFFFGVLFSTILTLFEIYDPSLLPIEGPIFWLSLIFIPFGILYSLNVGTLLGLQQVRLFNLSELSLRSLLLIVLLILASFQQTSEVYVFATTVGVQIAVTIYFTIKTINFKFNFRPSLKVLKRVTKYSFMSYVATVFSYLALKASVLFVHKLSGSENAGYFAVAANIADVLAIFPAVLGMLLFSKLSAIQNVNEQVKLIRYSFWLTTLILSPAILILFFFSDIIIHILFGAQFAPASYIVKIMLPGALFVAMITIMQNVLAGTGRVSKSIYGPVVATVVSFFLIYLLVPTMGGLGAAYAYSIATSCWFFINYLILKKDTRHGVENDLIVSINAPSAEVSTIHKGLSKNYQHLNLRFLASKSIIELIKALAFKDYRYVYLDSNDISKLGYLLELVSLIIPCREIRVIQNDGTYKKKSKAAIIPLIFEFFLLNLVIRVRLFISFLHLKYLVNANIVSISRPLDKNIVYLKTNFWFGVKAGGSVGHIAGIVNSLNRLGFNITFCSAESPIMVDSDVRYYNVPFSKPLAFPPELNSYLYDWKMKASVLDLMSRQVSWIYQRMSVGNYTGVKLSRRFKTPLVLEYNGSEVWVSNHWGNKLRWHRTAELCEYVSLKHAHAIVTVSDVLRDELIERGVEAKKIVTYPNCIDPQLFSPDRFRQEEIIAHKKKLGFEEDNIICTFVGTFGKWHGVDVLVKVIKSLVDEDTDLLEKHKVKFLFVGDGVEAKHIGEVIGESKYRKYYNHVGIVPQQDTPLYLAISSIFLSPHTENPDGSKFFGSPTKLFEYMAFAKPIVASDLAQIGVVLRGQFGLDKGSEKKLAILTKPGNVQDFKEGIIKLVENPKLARQLGESARKEVLEKFTWNIHSLRILEKLSELYSFSNYEWRKNDGSET